MELAELYTHYQSPIYRLCLGYTNDPDLALDLVQETFIAVWQNLDTFQSASKISTWIYRIAVNKCLTHIRSEKRRAARQQKAEFLMEEYEAEVDEKLSLMRKFISELKEVDRLIIGMVLEKNTLQEIGDVMDMKEAAIKVRVHRIKKQLHQKFEEDGRYI